MIVLGVTYRHEDAQDRHFQKIKVLRLGLKPHKQTTKTDELGEVASGPPAIREVDPGDIGRTFTQVIGGFRLEGHILETGPVSRDECIEALLDARNVSIRAGLDGTDEVEVWVEFNAARRDASVLHAEGDGSDATERVQHEIRRRKFKVDRDIVR